MKRIGCPAALCEYIATVRHDNGTIRLTVYANNTGAARLLVCQAEGCPLYAVTIRPVIH